METENTGNSTVTKDDWNIMKISIVRGAYLNNYEGQNYNLPLIGYSSLFPLDDHVPFLLVKLPSISDLQKISFLDKPIKYLANRTLGDSQILFGLEKYISSSDIVHIADPHYYYSYQSARLKEKGIVKKLVSTWWETIPHNNESTGAKKRIKKFTMNQVDMFICHSESAKKCLIEEGISSQKITLVPLGVNISLFRPKVREKTSDFIILFVGRLVKEKGIMDLYEVFKQIGSKEKNIILRIVGSGPLESLLKIAIRKDGFQDRVTIEHKSYQKMHEVYRQADILCVPSKKINTWEEQYGMVFVEAMASGVPVVSYATGAIPELIRDAGLLTNEGNIEQLAQSIKRLYSDSKLCVKIGTIGRERAKKLFDAQKTAIAIQKLYESVVNNHE